MTLKLTKQYKRKMTKKLLSELSFYRSSMDYCTRLTNIENLSLRKSRIARTRLLTLSNTIQAVEQAISHLSGPERDIIELHYIKEHTFSEIEEIFHLERSSVYRYHVMAVDKIAAVLYGD